MIAINQLSHDQFLEAVETLPADKAPAFSAGGVTIFELEIEGRAHALVESATEGRYLLIRT